MSVTIKDIAEHTGLAISTISKYINGGNVLPENQVKIQEAIEKMNFSVNPFARSMKTNKSYVIGVIISMPNDGHTYTLINMIEKQLMFHGYLCMIVSCECDEESQKKVTNLMLQRNIDGLLFLNMYVQMDDFSQFKEKPIPILTIGNKPENEKCDQICFDDYLAVNTITSFFLTKTKHVAYIAGDKYDYSQKKRYEGYLNAFKKANISPEQKLISFGESNDDSGYNRMLDIISGNNIPSALIIADPSLVIGSSMALIKSGIHIPDDLTLAAFKVEGLPDSLCKYVNLLSLPLKRISEVATKILLEKIETNQDLYESIQIPYELKITD